MVRARRTGCRDVEPSECGEITHRACRVAVDGPRPSTPLHRDVLTNLDYKEILESAPDGLLIVSERGQMA